MALPGTSGADSDTPDVGDRRGLARLKREDVAPHGQKVLTSLARAFSDGIDMFLLELDELLVSPELLDSEPINQSRLESWVQLQDLLLESF